MSVTEEELRKFIVETVSKNRSLPIALLIEYDMAHKEKK